MMTVCPAGPCLHEAPPARRPPPMAHDAIVTGAPPPPGSRVTLEGGAPADGLYTRPRVAPFELQSLWSSAHDDSLSAWMLACSGAGARTLADRWRGLGGALLQHLAAGGEAWRQTWAQVAPPATDAAADVPGEAALEGVAAGAVTLDLKLQTRSGQTISLAIAVNDGQHGGTRGLQVEVSASGALGEVEREALATLAGGLDQALDGLGQREAKLDLSGLLSGGAAAVFPSLELAFEDPNADPASGLQSLRLQVQGERRSLALTGIGGRMDLSVDAASTAACTTAGRRGAAVEQWLAQVGAAGQRGHADARMLDAFKQGFRQLQAPPPDAPASPRDDLAGETGALQSGLADFDASFSADSRRCNRFGGTAEQGHMDYHAGQLTRTRRRGDGDGETLEQTQSEATSAVYRRTRTLMLDLEGGDYDETTIEDRRTQRTLIETDGHRVLRALRKTDEQRLLRFASLEDHHVVARRDTPQQRSVLERLR